MGYLLFAAAAAYYVMADLAPLIKSGKKTAWLFAALLALTAAAVIWAGTKGAVYA